MHETDPATRGALSAPGGLGSGLTWPPALPFEVLLAHAREMDRSALAALYRRYLPLVYRFALARSGSVHSAEEITSDTFFAVIEGIGSLRASDELGFIGWVLGIARNKVALYFRRQRTHEPLPDGDQATAPLMFSPAQDDPLAVVTLREEWAEVAHALEQLTDEQRAVVLYRCVLGYSAEDVGQIIGKRPGTVRALQFRGLQSLARLLAQTPTHGQRSTTPSRAEWRPEDAP